MVNLIFIDSVQQILVFVLLISIFINFHKYVGSNFIHYEISLIYFLNYIIWWKILFQYVAWRWHIKEFFWSWCNKSVGKTILLCKFNEPRLIFRSYRGRKWPRRLSSDLHSYMTACTHIYIFIVHTQTHNNNKNLLIKNVLAILKLYCFAAM